MTLLLCVEIANADVLLLIKGRKHSNLPRLVVQPIVFVTERRVLATSPRLNSILRGGTNCRRITNLGKFVYLRSPMLLLVIVWICLSSGFVSAAQWSPLPRSRWAAVLA